MASSVSLSAALTPVCLTPYKQLPTNSRLVQPTPAKTFFDNAQSGLDKPIFGAYLPKGTDGAYDFGATDSSKFTGSLTYTKVDSSKGFWEYPSTSFKVGSSTGFMDSYTGITDTGTTLVLMADAAVTAYYQQVPGASNSQRYVQPALQSVLATNIQPAVMADMSSAATLLSLTSPSPLATTWLLSPAL
jgi:hypothetical protein